MGRTLIAVCAVVVLFAPPVWGQHLLRIEDGGLGDVGELVTLSTWVIIDEDADEIGAVSFGLCHTEDRVSVDEVLEGPDLEEVGDAFSATTIYADGWTSGLIVSYSGETLGAGTYEVWNPVYDLAAEGVADLEFCDTLGTPPVALEVVVGIDGVLPDLDNATIVITDLDPNDYFLSISTGEGIVGEDVTLTVDLQITDTGEAMDAVQFGVCHDDLVDLDEGDIEQPAALDTDFYTVELVDGGWWGAMLSDATEDDLPADATTTLAEVTYTLGKKGGMSNIELCGELGDPAVPVRVISGEVEFEPHLRHGFIDIRDIPEFLRGDADNSGDVSGIPDGLFMLKWQFAGGDEPQCADAADADDNGSLSGLGDGIFLFQYQFLDDGPEPPLPGPIECGRDPETAPDALGCEVTLDLCVP